MNIPNTALFIPTGYKMKLLRPFATLSTETRFASLTYTPMPTSIPGVRAGCGDFATPC